MDTHTKKDLISVIKEAKKQSQGYRTVNIITLILEIIVAVVCLIIFAVTLAVEGIFSILITSGKELLAGEIELVHLFTVDWFGLFASAVAIPLLIYLIFSWSLSFPLENILEKIILGIYIKKTGYSVTDTLDILDKPSLLKEDIPTATEDMSEKERKKVLKLAFKAEKEIEHNLEDTYVLLPFLEKTNGRFAAVIEIIVKYINSVITGICTVLSFALAMPLGIVVNNLIEKLMPDVRIIGAFLVFVVIWFVILFVVLPLCKLLDKLIAKNRKKNLEKWWNNALESTEE